MKHSISKFGMFLLLCFVLFGCNANINYKLAINILDSSANFIENDTGEFEFSSILIDTSTSEIFTILNTGSADLKLKGNPKVAISGTGEIAFTVTEQPKTVIKPSDTTTFTIEFAPTIAQNFEATVTIISNDKDLSPFTFSIKGTGLAPGINVKHGDVYIPNSTGSFYFRNVLVSDSSQEVTFAIENLGSYDLNLTGTPKIEISGSDAALFNLNQTAISTPIAPDDFTTFTIIFSPESIGLKSATISIASDDYDQNPYTFTIVGTGISPEINIKQNADNIPSTSGKYDFDEILVTNSSSVIEFTIENLGTADLHLTGSPKIVKSGVDAAMFSIEQTSIEATIEPSQTTSFKITFNPTSTGSKSATISIANDDLDENPYTFIGEGTGISPEINIKQGSDNIANSTGEYYFAGVRVNESTPEIEFTIENLGDADLKLTGSPIVEITGTNASEFSLNTSTTLSTITPGNYTTFKIQCNPITKGLKTATVSIANNDNNENPFTFTIRGLGSTYIKGDFNGDGYQDVIVGAPGDDDGGIASGCAFIFFGCSNWNSRIDASNADVKLIGEDVGDNFGVSVSSAGDVNNDGYDDVIVGTPHDDGGGSQSGCAYIFFGCSNWNSSIDASNADVKLIGEDSGNWFGLSVSSAGDVNNDGYDDVIVGANNDDDGGSDSGCAFIFFGSSNLNSSIDASNADVKLIGGDANDQFGRSVSSAGDVNNDGYDDVIAGAYADDDGGYNSGCAFIFFGRQNWNSIIDASNADVELIGEDSGDHFGLSVSSAGDVNNDGYDDVIVGASLYDDGGTYDSGCAYIFFGRSNWNSSIDASNANVKLIGENVRDDFGWSVSSAGDVNNDGFDDVIIGAQRDDDGGASSGCAFIFFGKANWNSRIDASNADVKLIGEDSYDYFGKSVSSAGDVNNDGFADIIIGASLDDDGGNSSGCAFIFFGRNNWNSSMDSSSANVKLIGEDEDDKFGGSVSGN